MSSAPKIAPNRGIRHGDISADANGADIVTVTVGTGDNHQHLELTYDEAVRLSDVLSGLLTWHD